MVGDAGIVVDVVIVVRRFIDFRYGGQDKILTAQRRRQERIMKEA